MLLAKRTVLFLLALLAAVSVVVVVVRAQHFHGGDPTRFEPDQDTGEGKLGTDYHGLGTEPESASDGHGVGAGEPHEGGEQETNLPPSRVTKGYTELAQEALAVLRSLSPRVDPLPTSGSSRSKTWSTLSRLVGPIAGLLGAGPRGAIVAPIAKMDGLDALPVIADKDPEDLKRAKALKTLETLGLEYGNEEALFVLAELSFFSPFGHPRNLTRSFDLYAQCAQKHGNATAQGMVGFMFATGFGAPEQNQAKAMLYYTFAALGQDPSSEMALGYRYLAGIGTQKNCDEAVWYYKKAAQKTINYWLTGPPGGHLVPPSKHRLSDDDGGTYGPSASGAGNPNPSGGRNAGDGALTPDDVLQYWQYTADRGDATAQFLLGQLYHGGTAAVVQDYGQALKYFHLAAMQYDPPAPNPNGGPVQITQAHAQRLNAAAQAAGQLGQMYFRGEGVDVDNSTARRWFEKGAQHSEASSLNGLGMMHLDGSGGLPKDLKKAYQYFLKAAEQNHAHAQANLGELYLRQGKKEYTNALKYFTLASRQGHLLAMFRLGDMYLEGQGTQSNCMVAAAFFKSVSERGDWHDPLLEDALDAYYDGDTETAFLEYALAAERGYEVAQTNAAWMIDQAIYPSGSSSQVFGSDLDPYATALVYWNRAANQGNVDARVKVGDYYYYGLGHSHLSKALAAFRAKKSVASESDAGIAVGTGTAGELPGRNTLPPAGGEGDAAAAAAGAEAPMGEVAPGGASEPPVPAPAGSAQESTGSASQTAGSMEPEAHRPSPPLWTQVVGAFMGWPSGGSPNYERAAMYYQTAADSEHSSLAMWNLGWMHECGVGVERDFHLAKRYYDRSLSTNPDGYLPVTIALSKLKTKQFVYSLLGLGSSSGGGKDGQGKKQRSRAKQDEPVVIKVDSLPAPGEAAPAEGGADGATTEGGENDNYDWWEKQGAAVESTTENVLILVLVGVLGLLLFVRQRHGQWRGEPYGGGGGGGAAGAPAGPAMGAGAGMPFGGPHGFAPAPAVAQPIRAATPQPQPQAQPAGNDNAGATTGGRTLGETPQDSELRQRRAAQAGEGDAGQEH